jgi:flagellin
LSVATLTQAQSALDAVDSALSTINSTRATLGAYQNRFQSVVANLQTASENLSASRSRIVDADFAAETAQLTKAQILQQSGIAMLAQANAIPQNVLALLQ